MLQIIRTLDKFPITHKVNVRARFEPGMIAQGYLREGEIICDISDGTNPCGIIDDTNNIDDGILTFNNVIASGKVILFGSGTYRTDIYWKAECWNNDYKQGNDLYVYNGKLTDVKTSNKKCVGEVISLRNDILKCELYFPEFPDVIVGE
jgi:hypothetical protein